MGRSLSPSMAAFFVSLILSGEHRIDELIVIWRRRAEPLATPAETREADMKS